MKTTRTQRAKRLCNALGWKNPHATVVAAVSNAFKLEGRIEYKLGWHGAMDSLDGPNGERVQMKAYAERVRADLTRSKASVAGLLKERDAALAEAVNLKQELSKERAAADALKSAASTSSAKCEAALVDLDAMRNDRNRYADIARQRFEEIAKLNARVQRADELTKERDALRGQLESVRAAHDSVIRERDTLRGQLESVRAAHDSVVSKLDVALSDVTWLMKERDLLISQKMPPRNVWVPWAWRVEHVGSTFDSTKPRHADGCSGAYKDSDADYSGCIPSCPVAIAYLESTATRLTKERDATINRKMPKGNVLVPAAWRITKQANGTANHSDDCDRQQGWLHEGYEKYPGCLPTCPAAIEYLAEVEKRATPILPSSLRVNQRIEWTCNDYGARCAGDVVYVGGGRANVKRDGAGIVILFDTNARTDAICIVEHNNPHAECDRKLAEARESLRSTTEATHMLASKWHAADVERDAALRDLNKARADSDAAYRDRNKLADTTTALVKERDALQFRVNEQAQEIKRFDRELIAALNQVGRLERELAEARVAVADAKIDRDNLAHDTSAEACAALRRRLDCTIAELAQANASIKTRELAIEDARTALAAVKLPVTERPELVQVPDSFKSPFDGSHSPACYGAPHSDSRCIRGCKRRIAWEAEGCPSP